MRAKVVELNKYEGSEGKLFDDEKDAINDIVKFELYQITTMDQYHYDVDYDRQVESLIKNRDVVVQLLKEWTS